MTKALTPTEKYKNQCDNTNTPPKTSITQRLRTDTILDINTDSKFKEQKRSTEGCSKLKSPETRQVGQKSQSGTGPGVRRSKRPLLACRTRCKCSMEISHN